MRSRHAKAFTLLELLIVVSLISVITMALIPTVDATVYDQVRATADIVAADVSYCQSLAITNNSTYRVRFEVPENRYVIEHSGIDSALDTLPDGPFRDPSDPADEHIVDLDELPGTGIAVKILAVTENNSRVDELEFNALGALTSGEETTIWLRAGSATDRRYMPVYVDPITGLTSIGDFTTVAPTLAESVSE